VTQFPIFVECDDRHVAAVVTTPDEPRGLVISLAGTGRHNVVGSTFCAQLSQRVAELGLASVRLDYAGVGDSPGGVASWSLSDTEAAARQAGAVLAVALEGLGVEAFAAVGTCYGTRVALSLVGEPGCRAAVCLGPPLLQYGGLASAGRRAGGSQLASLVRSNAVLRRLAAPLRRAGDARKPAPVVLRALAQLDRVPITFLYGDPPFDDHYSDRAQEVLDGALAQVPSELREHFEQRMLPWGPLTTFDILAPEDQTAVLDVVVSLLEPAFANGREPVAAPGRSVG
jgi:hypothetical protein